MSVVIGIKDKDRVWLGCDSQLTRCIAKTTTSSGHQKVFKPCEKDNSILIGSVGNMRDVNLLQTNTEYLNGLCNMRIENPEKELTFNYMVKNVVPALFKLYEENARLDKKDEIPELGHQTMYAQGTKLFQVDSDGAVLEIDTQYAIGSGAHFALGNMHGTEYYDNKSQVIANAIRAAIANDIYVDYPIIIKNTLDDEVIYIEK